MFGHLSLASNRVYRYLVVIFRNDFRYSISIDFLTASQITNASAIRILQFPRRFFIVVMILPELSLQIMLVAVDKSLVDNKSPFFLEAFVFRLHHSARGEVHMFLVQSPLLRFLGSSIFLP